MTEDIKFEEALSKLESLVEELERGELSLEESLAAFEEGIRLSRICSKQLDEAERKIEILIKGEDGQLRIEDFDSKSEH
jgi:exodeoxyribonuclease VII small subunit